jgi:hypothetical protein
MTEPTNFRQRLDAVLRTLDVEQVSKFLIAENQWSPDTPADPELAMWMMIAGSSSLRDLHPRAIQWLSSHGHSEEASIFQAREKKSVAKARKGKQQTYLHKRKR